MNLTITKITFMHGACSNIECPVCKDGTNMEVDTWLRKKLNVISTGAPRSPWWTVEEQNGDCYRILRGDLKKPGYYDKNPEAQ
jgi:hypothetical protein